MNGPYREPEGEDTRKRKLRLARSMWMAVTLVQNRNIHMVAEQLGMRGPNVKHDQTPNEAARTRQAIRQRIQDLVVSL